MTAPSKTPLYREALIEAQKLKEAAESEAKARVVKSITPYIKEMLDKEIAGILMEEEDPTLFPDAAAGAAPLPPATPGAATVSPDASLDASAPAPATEIPSEPSLDSTPIDPGAAPIAAPAAAPMAGGVSIPLPDESGKFVVDIDDLFEKTPEGTEPVLPGAATDPMAAMSPDTAMPSMEPTGAMPPVPGPEAMPPAEMPAPPPAPEEEEGQGEGMSYDTLKEAIETFKSRLDQNIATGKLNSVFMQKVFEERLFVLYENLQALRAENKIHAKLGSLQEQRLELYFKRLNKESVKEGNSYSSNNDKVENMTTTVKKLAKSLFEDAAAGFGDDGEASQEVKNSMDGASGEKASKHAKSASDSTPVEDPGKEAALKLSEELEEEFKKIEEELSEGHEGFGDTTEKVKNDTVIKDRTGQTPSGKDAMPEGVEMFEVSEKELQDEAVKLKKESLTRKMKQLKEEAAKVAKALKECGGAVGTGEAAEINVNINLSDLDGDMGGVDGGETIDLVDGDDDMTATDSGEGDMPSFGGSDMDTAGEPEVTDEPEEKTSMVAEGKKSSAKQSVVEADLRKQLAEHQIVTARAMYKNKFLSLDNLSKKQKQKIAEYLDSARTVSEAKALYSRLTAILAENAKKTATAAKQKGNVGSSSKPTKSGSSAPLNESKAAPGSDVTIPVSRWQELAGIKANK